MAATIPTPYFVYISKLETQFHLDPEYTQHVEYISNSTTKQRGTRKEVKWKRERVLGQGGSGIVWSERCIQGDSQKKVRAVKKIPKLKSDNYTRELEAIALFSQTKVGLPFSLIHSSSFPQLLS